MQQPDTHSPAAMPSFERYLSVWVLACIANGVALGQWLLGTFQAIGRLALARVETPLGTRPCRPSEGALDILPAAPSALPTPFAKEDGQGLIDAKDHRVAA